MKETGVVDMGSTGECPRLSEDVVPTRVLVSRNLVGTVDTQTNVKLK